MLGRDQIGFTSLCKWKCTRQKSLDWRRAATKPLGRVSVNTVKALSQCRAAEGLRKHSVLPVKADSWCSTLSEDPCKLPGKVRHRQDEKWWNRRWAVSQGRSSSQSLKTGMWLTSKVLSGGVGYVFTGAHLSYSDQETLMSPLKRWCCFVCFVLNNKRILLCLLNRFIGYFCRYILHAQDISSPPWRLSVCRWSVKTGTQTH